MKIKFSIIRRLFIFKYIFSKIELVLGQNIRLIQKTILSGKGKIILGDNITIVYKIGGYFYHNVTELQSRYPKSEIIIGNNVILNNSCMICAFNKIEIGQSTLVGANVLMMDSEAHGTHPLKRNELGVIGEIVIGKNVWIGSNVTILKNVYIGDNSIVAAGSVFLKGIYPENSIIGGNPAKVAKKIEI